jgi:prepilin-type N-terminal cleavage/methylation domain-containing protein
MKSSNPTTTKRRSDSSQGFSLIELLIVVAIILIIAAIAIPNMLASKRSANQASAVAGLRTITSAAVAYSVTYGDGYPPNFAALTGVNGTAATCNAAILIDPTIAASPNQKAGYQFAYTGQEANFSTQPANCAAPGFNGYLLTAAPISQGITGNMSYCSTEQGVIHVDPNGATPADQTTCLNLQPLQ